MGLLEEMDLEKMTDTGMWVWAGLLTVVGLAASWVIALWWLRRQEKRRDGA